jgi:hypothetical protein
MATRVLLWVGPLHVVGGLLLFLTAFLPDLQNTIAATTGLAGENFSPFLFAVFGPTVASWGVLFTAVVCQFNDYPTRRLWRAMVLAVAVWAPLDTGLCLYYGVYGGVVVNGVVVVLLFGLLCTVRPTGK